MEVAPPYGTIGTWSFEQALTIATTCSGFSIPAQPVAQFSREAQAIFRCVQREEHLARLGERLATRSRCREKGRQTTVVEGTTLLFQQYLFCGGRADNDVRHAIAAVV